jgi:hypothetical protein
MSWHAIVADFQAHFWSYLGMPLVAAFVGYTTKIAALEMMFRPIEFIGIKPYLAGKVWCRAKRRRWRAQRWSC